jgi:hypothetical protein
MTIKDIIGDYSILGTNQNDSGVTYSGTLKLSLKNNQIIAKWLINKNQEQFGIGFFKNNILVINFNYKGEENNTYYGTIFYKCLNKDILEGYWTEEYGDPTFLGTENCFRIKNSLVN